ncbi:MAG: AsmA family protein [Parvibaculaceae bacterium]
MKKKTAASLNIKRLIGIAAAVGLFVGIGFAALPYTLGGDFARRAVEDAVKDATGRTVTFSGRPRISLWPEGEVELDNVVVSGPAPAHVPFAAIGTIRLKANAMPLFLGRLEIKSITLDKPVIDLNVDRQGNLNFLDAASKDTAGATQRLPLFVRDGVIRFRDDRTGASFEATDADLTVATPGKPLDVKGFLTWKQRRIEVTVYIRAPERLSTDGSPADITIEAPELVAAFSGRAALKNGLSLAGQIEAKSPSLTELAAWSGIDFEGVEGFKDMTLTAALDLSGRKLQAKDARIGLDGMQGEGDFSLMLGEPKPKVGVKLKLDRLNLNAYARPSESTALTQGWRDTRIDLGALSAVDGVLDIDTAEIIYGTLRTGPASIKAKLEDGTLDAQLDGLALYGGRGRGRLLLDGSTKLPEIRGALEADGVSVQGLLGDFMGFKALSGAGRLSLSLSAKGSSQLELASTLTGQARLEVANGAFADVDLKQLAQAATSAPVAGWQAEAARQTAFSSFAAVFAITDGIAEVQTLKLAGGDFQTDMTGSIDVLRQRLDLDAAVTIAGQARNVRVDGLWNAPQFAASGTSGKADPEAEPPGQDQAPNEKTGKAPQEKKP